ncbi:MAG: zinc-ribbon domain-containing protein [Paracoccaceae bacterium]|nr:zinc-ribbon domain-containing protein [Paracoccaceae bacterium]
MRLVCPNCSAQYEIDGSMIPDEGRDVQCSNCGHTWFELPGPAEPAAAMPAGDAFGADDTSEDVSDFEEPSTEPTASSRAATRPENLSREVFEAEDDETDFQRALEEAAYGDDAFIDDASEESADAEAPDEASASEHTEEQVATEETTAPEEEILSEPDEDADAGGYEEDAAVEDQKDIYADATAAVAAAAAATTVGDSGPEGRRPADAADLDILREEAERELSQRRAPPSETIETQADLGLDTIRNRETPSRALRARMAHLGEDAPEMEARAKPESPKLETPAEPEEDVAYEEPKRDLLPDIDEINSTLKPSPRGTDSMQDAKRRSGFRIGFFLVVFLVIAMIFAYAQAPAIARALPEAEAGLITYVDRANQLRDWISGLISG